MIKYNFSAGPAVLPKEVISSINKEAFNYKKSGMSVFEMSHRSRFIMDLFEESESRVKSILNIPLNYKVLWLSGGASLQFSMVPLNLMNDGGKADYIETGSWSTKAINECRKVGEVNIAASSKSSNFCYIPKNYNQDFESVYTHITSNNTIYGTQYKSFPDLSNKKSFLVGDMSSDIFSRPIDINKFGLIYAGAQKNIGIAGVTLVILRDDLIKKSHRVLPSMLDYRIHVKKKSMFNTPPVFCVYVVNETLKWIETKGGLEKMETQNNTKSTLLYNEIDGNKLFTSPVHSKDRSTMNAVFKFSDSNNNEDAFLNFCYKKGLMTLKGHRSIGGFRASIYNGMPIDGVKELIKAMREYSKK